MFNVFLNLVSRFKDGTWIEDYNNIWRIQDRMNRNVHNENHGRSVITKGREAVYIHTSFLDIL
jgi:hypothetical protein